MRVGECEWRQVINSRYEWEQVQHKLGGQQDWWWGETAAATVPGCKWVHTNEGASMIEWKQAGWEASKSNYSNSGASPPQFIYLGQGGLLSEYERQPSPPPPVLLKHCNVIVISIIFIINILCTTTGFVTVPVTNPIHPQLNHPQSPLHWCPLMHHTKLIIVLPHKLTLCLSRALFMKFFTDLAHLTVSSRWLCAILRQFVPRDPSLLRKRKWEMESKENQIYCKRLSRSILR